MKNATTVFISLILVVTAIAKQSPKTKLVLSNATPSQISSNFRIFRRRVVSAINAMALNCKTKTTCIFAYDLKELDAVGDLLDETYFRLWRIASRSHWGRSVIEGLPKTWRANNESASVYIYIGPSLWETV